MSLTPEVQRAADKIMADMIAMDWQPDPHLEEAVLDAFITGRSEWNGLAIEVVWRADPVQ